ncbi:MAG: sensor histidine kinase, partial [Acetobacter papayae]
RVTLYIACDNFWMDPDQAVPLALIVTEIVTNAIKYAFPDGRCGTITMRLHRDEHQVTLYIGDDGIGFDFNEEAHTQGIGLRLIRGFVRQLRGVMEYSSREGVQFTLTIPMKENESTNGYDMP